MKVGMGGPALVAIALALAGGAARAQAGRDFDLQCEGTIDPVNGPPAPWSNHFRVALDRGVFCGGACTDAKGSRAFEATNMLTLSKAPLNVSVDMATGNFTGSVGDDHFHGQCAPAPYTPIPPIKP